MYTPLIAGSGQSKLHYSVPNSWRNTGMGRHITVAPIEKENGEIKQLPQMHETELSFN